MANQPHKYKDRDIKRVVKAARAAGIAIHRIEVDPNSGRISVVAGPASGASEPNNAFDTWKAEREKNARPA